MLTTRALGAPHPLAHNVIGEGLHWLHAVAQPDTAIINPRLAAIIVDGHVLRFVPIARGGGAAVIIDVADVHWGLSGAPLNPAAAGHDRRDRTTDPRLRRHHQRYPLRDSTVDRARADPAAAAPDVERGRRTLPAWLPGPPQPPMRPAPATGRLRLRLVQRRTTRDHMAVHRLRPHTPASPTCCPLPRRPQGPPMTTPRQPSSSAGTSSTHRHTARRTRP